MLTRDGATRVGLVMLENGDDPATVTRRDVRRGDRPRSRGRRLRPDPAASPATTTPQPLAKGDLAAARRLVGRHRPAPGRQPEAQVGDPRDGRDDLDRQHAHPDAAGASPTASTYMNFVYDPKIAAQIAAGVNYISPVKGVKEEAREDRPRGGEQPAHLPDRRDARAAAPVRPGGAQQRRRTSRAVAEGARAT